MKYLLVVFALMTLMSISVAYAMVEMYRIEMESYDSRIIAFYDTYFKYIFEDSNATASDIPMPEQIQSNMQDIAL
jgi:hypothetical protein